MFAIELLKRPIKLQRNQKGHVAITVDRTGVQEMIISNKGKMAKVQQYVTLDKADRLLALDKQIQSFLAGSNSLTEMQIDLPTLDICLRWPSGGVLSIVTDNENNR